MIDTLAVWLREFGDDELKRALGEWIRQVLLPQRSGMEVLPPMPQLEEVRTMLAERVREWTAPWFEEGREEGVRQGIERGRAEERSLLCRQTARKFGTVTAERLSGLLDGLSDHDRLAEIGEWIIECNTGAELLDRAEGSRGRS